MMPAIYPSVFLLALLAFSVSAVCGGGAGLLLIPILGTALPVSYVPAALSIGTATSSVSRIITFYKHIRWDVVVWFVPASLPAVWLGSWLLQYLNPLYVQLLMGLFLVANLPQLLRRNQSVPTPTNSKVLLVCIGFLVGLVSGLTGAVGLLFNRFYLRYGMTKEQIMATRAANEVVLQLLKLMLYATFGLLTSRVIGLGIATAVAAILSARLMKWLLPYLSETLFRRIGYGAMVIAGASLLTDSGGKLATQNRADIDLMPIAQGYESKIRWADTRFSFEFVYDEGFEYEQVIALTDLNSQQQAFVRNQTAGADRYLIEEVFGVGEHGYELYISRKGKTQKLDFT